MYNYHAVKLILFSYHDVVLHDIITKKPLNYSHRLYTLVLGTKYIIINR